MKRETQLMKLVGKHLDDPTFDSSAGGEKEKKHNSVVTEQLVPKVIEMDADGRPISEHETLRQQIQAVEVIPWSTWAEKETKRNPNNIAKLFLLMAIDSLHENWSTPYPIALVRKGNVIEAKATKALRVGELVVPLFFKKQNSVVTEEGGGTIHPKAVDVQVIWPEEVDVKAAELRGDGGDKSTTPPAKPPQQTAIAETHVQVRLKVQPELKLPTSGAKGLDWTQSDAVHPFWFIQRTEKHEFESNADLTYQDVTHLTACSFTSVSCTAAQFDPTANTFAVSLPFIVNTKFISMGEEVILKWKRKDDQSKRKRDQPDTNAFDEIAKEDKRQRRAKTGV